MTIPHSLETTVQAGDKRCTSYRTLQMVQIEDHSAWPKLSHMEMPFSVAVELSAFNVRDLITLTPGQVIETSWKESDDVSIKAADVQIGWGEFEVDEQKLLIRMTRLA
jgi:flagellar motor switch/type III secretory pathway protein FliN